MLLGEQQVIKNRKVLKRKQRANYLTEESTTISGEKNGKNQKKK